jgi:hypothetical protein
MADTLLSEQIYLSRDSIRELIAIEVKRYLELENVDLTKSSFLSFIIDTVSTITGNLLFYQLSSYREFFLTKAQLPESILNLSAFLGYNTLEATPATASVLITIPFGFDDPITQFTIPENFTFNADGSVDFLTYYSTTIEVTGNANVTVVVTEGNKRYNLPVSLDTESFSFVLPLRQVKIVEQEFQIDSDIQSYQFVTLDVPVDGEVAELTVEIQDPGSAGTTTWTEFDSLFLMDPLDKGYISRRTDTGRRLTFGNGLIGVQPTPGSTVYVTVLTTEGSEGNVIAGSIRSGDRIYLTTLAGTTQIVDYEVVNASSAYGGEDEESLEEVRRNSIASIRALERLVTESDYQDISVVAPEVPFAQNALPVLKRSDLQVNEIELFSGLLFGTGTDEISNLVPTRNAVFTIPSTTSRIYRNETITIGDSDYYTLFEIDIDTLNTVGQYEYIILSVDLLPALETSYSSDYDIYSDLLEIERVGTQGIFKLHYKSGESDADLTTCTMKIQSSGSTKIMTNDSTNNYFIYTFNPYTDIPKGEQTYEFTIRNPSNVEVALYSNKVTFRSDLSTFMRSNVDVSDGTTYTVFDVPVIEKDYYDSIDKRAFELQVMQALISTADLSDRRMLTDFTNIKFSNTYGVLNTMLLNQPTITSVIDIVPVEPTICDVGDRYILAPPSRDAEYQDNVIRCVDATALIFLYEEPVSDSIVYVELKGENYIYSAGGWIPLPIYNIPLEIEIEVFRSSSFSGTLASLQDLVRTTLIEAFEDRFGTAAEIYRSEIIDVVQEIDGVSHCSLRKPETSIFFNFELKELTEDQLLRYGPEYVYFTEDSISVRVV